MKAFIESSLFFPVLAGVIFYILGDILRKKIKLSIVNPLLISVTLTIITLMILDVDYTAYESGAKYLNYLLTPATVCLAIPLYRQLHTLKGNTVGIIAGIVAGVVTSLFAIFAMSLAFGFDHGEYVTLLPKSITTAIGLGVSKELGGNESVTAAAIIVTGIFGNISAPIVLKIFGIKDPVAKGVAIGSASHVIGTTKAMEMGRTEGAVSSLSIVIAGMITVLGAYIFSGFIV